MTRIRHAVVDTVLGPMLVAATDRGLCRLSFDEDEVILRRFFPDADLVADCLEGDREFAGWVAAAQYAVANPREMSALPLDLHGTPFQKAVWQQLLAIPVGETCTYGDIARTLGMNGGERAVGSANGANPVSVLVPCHRVIRADGGLGGYAYGLARKRRLLEAEGALEQAALDL